MKKLFYLAVAACTAMLTACGGGNGPVKVSHNPENRTVLIEEFTGIKCGYCPTGHRMAADVMNAHPGQVMCINYHTSSYASGTYTTEYGDALDDQARVQGYPSGTVNRHEFSDKDRLAMFPDEYEKYAGQMLQMSAPVNIAANATIDRKTRHLTVNVSAYYTADANSEAANGTNSLNIAILQDNVLGPQSGKEDNPDYCEGDQYRHMHMFRHFLTGQWGEEISGITKGTEFTKTYEYDIPEKLGKEKPIDAVLEDLRIVVFIAEGRTEVLNACEANVKLK